jgi:hypothetical protein
VRIFRNVEALPRSFVAHAAEVLSDPDRQLERLVDDDFDPQTTVLLERVPPTELQRPSSAPDDSIRIVRYEPAEVTIDVDAAAAGILVLTDLHYPGWHAEVDGIPTEILIADYLFRGVPVSAGAHRVVFRFSPSSVRDGLVVAIIGPLVALALVLALRGRSPPPRGTRPSLHSRHNIGEKGADGLVTRGAPFETALRASSGRTVAPLSRESLAELVK